MKRLILAALALGMMATVAHAQQGMEFFTGTWQEALDKARAEKKPIFVDVYTSWCGPCKQMAKDVFPQAEVGAKFNSSFINYKVDAEKGEGVAIARQFGVNAFPTYLFVNGEGVLCYRALGSMPAADFIAQADKALVEFKDPKPLPAWEAEYASRKTDKEFLLQYLRKRQNLALDSGEIIDQYATVASEEDLLSKAVLDLLLQEEKVRVDGPYYSFLAGNAAKVAEISGTPLQRINGQLSMYVHRDLERSIDKKDAALMEKIVAATLALPARDEGAPNLAADGIRLRFYSETGNEPETIKVLERHGPQVAQRDKKKIEAADAAGAKQFEAMLKAAPADVDPQQMEMARRIQSKQGSMAYAFALRDVAGAALKAVNDKKVLGEALQWIELAGTYSDNFTIAETRAGLFYKIGRTSEAMREMEQAIATFDAMKIPADSIRSRLTASLEKMRAGKPTWLAEKSPTVAVPR